MILKKLVTEKVIEYFRSEQWEEIIRVLSIGEDVLHAHVYAQSILAPRPVGQVIKDYFDIKGWPLQRNMVLVPTGRGIIDIYGIHPKGCGHFELFLQYSDQVVLEGTRDLYRGKSNVEWWDKAYMENYYKQFDFREFGPAEEKEVKAYFKSKEWEMTYLIMASRENFHSHTLIKTSIHPDILAKYGIAAIEAKGWKIGKTTSVLFSMKGLDRGKICFLLSKPEMILELEWDFDRDTIIEPGPTPIYRMYTEEMLVKDTAGLNYFILDETQINDIITTLKKEIK
jgi:hypothetical protein